MMRHGTGSQVFIATERIEMLIVLEQKLKFKDSGIFGRNLGSWASLVTYVSVVVTLEHCNLFFSLECWSTSSLVLPGNFSPHTQAGRRRLSKLVPHPLLFLSFISPAIDWFLRIPSIETMSNLIFMFSLSLDIWRALVRLRDVVLWSPEVRVAGHGACRAPKPLKTGFGFVLCWMIKCCSAYEAAGGDFPLRTEVGEGIYMFLHRLFFFGEWRISKRLDALGRTLSIFTNRIHPVDVG